MIGGHNMTTTTIDPTPSWCSCLDQRTEAYSLLADSMVSTPWIDAAASARGLDRLELAQRIVAKDAQYRVISGTLSGIRQRIEDQIDAAGDDQSALKAIDVTQGWPE